MHNHYFDSTHPLLLYTHSLPATPGTMPPDNAVRIAPERVPMFWPRLTATRDGWEQVEDHRQHKDDVGRVLDGSGTPHWLPGDTWQTPPRYMETVGPLPEGARLTQPEKMQTEIDAERRTLILAELAATDAASARALRAVLLDTQNGISPASADLAQLAACEAEAIVLREQLAETPHGV